MQYIVIREIEREGQKTIKVGKRLSERSAKRLGTALSPSLLPIDEHIFISTYNSFSFANWVKERAFIWDDRGGRTSTGLTKGPESVLLFLRDIGVTSWEIIQMMGKSEEYAKFLSIAGEFGQIVVE